MPGLPEHHLFPSRVAVPVLLLLVFLRLLFGAFWDPVIAAFGAGMAIMSTGSPTRIVWFWFALAVIAGAQLLPLPVRPVTRAEVPAWATTVVGSGLPGWSVAPWETVRYLILFTGAALWTYALQGRDLVLRRSTGYALRLFGVVVAIWVMRLRLDGWNTDIGENHIAILLAMLLAEPAARLRSGGLSAAFSVILIAGGVLASGAVLPAVLAALVVFSGLRPQERQMPWPQVYIVAAGAVVLVGACLWLLPSQQQNIGSRLAVWQDAAVLAWDVFPWGTGFGGFHWIFPAYAEHLPKPAMRALHPENAYLWLLIEGGLFAVCATVFLFGARKRRGTAARAARVALLVLAVECLIETPILWTPVFWLLPVFVMQGFTWQRPIRAEAEQV